MTDELRKLETDHGRQLQDLKLRSTSVIRELEQLYVSSHCPLVSKPDVASHVYVHTILDVFQCLTSMYILFFRKDREPDSTDRIGRREGSSGRGEVQSRTRRLEDRTPSQKTGLISCMSLSISRNYVKINLLFASISYAWTIR